MSVKEFDIIIVGAGPAGSTAVLALMNSGLRVAVLDKAVFPRDKICGDSVGYVAKRILRQIDPELEADLLRFAPKTYTNKATLYSANFTSLTLQFVKDGHCIRRRDFDDWLFQKAQSNKDAVFFQQIRITGIKTDENKAVVSLHDGNELHAQLIIGCDGAQSVVSKKLGNIPFDRDHYSAAVRRYYRNVSGLDGKTMEVYFLENYLPGYFWIFPLSDNEANVGFGMLSKTIAANKIDLKQSLDDIIEHIPEVKARFLQAEALEETKGFGLPLGAKKNPISGQRFMLCGDAASLVDPFSGEGISTAMESARFAAQQAIECFRQNDFSAASMSRYDEKVYAKLLKTFKNHRLLQRLLGKRTRLINLVIRVGNIPFIKRRLTKLFY